MLYWQKLRENYKRFQNSPEGIRERRANKYFLIWFASAAVITIIFALYIEEKFGNGPALISGFAGLLFSRFYLKALANKKAEKELKGE